MEVFPSTVALYRLIKWNQISSIVQLFCEETDREVGYEWEGGERGGNKRERDGERDREGEGEMRWFTYTAGADEALEISEGLDSGVPGGAVRFPLAQEIAGWKGSSTQSLPSYHGNRFAAVLINSHKAVAVGSNQRNNQQKTMSRALERLVSQRVFFFTEALILPPPTRLSTVGSRAFSVFSPSTWDDLHLPLRQKPFLDSFRSHFKALLFPKKYVCHVSAPSCYLPPPQVPVCYLFKLPVN